jgi:hypothetical protein
MAMTKAEKLHVADLNYEIERLKEQLALHHTSPVEPDVMPPTSCTGGLSTGWHASFSNWSGLSHRVDIACSSSTGHNIGRSDRTQSQGSRKLHSTRLLALRSARYQMEQMAAKSLRAVDVAIEKELADMAKREQGRTNES